MLQRSHPNLAGATYVYALLLWLSFLGRFFAGRLFGRVAELRPRYKPLDFRSENDDPARHLDRR